MTESIKIMQRRLRSGYLRLIAVFVLLNAVICDICDVTFITRSSFGRNQFQDTGLSRILRCYESNDHDDR